MLEFLKASSVADNILPLTKIYVSAFPFFSITKGSYCFYSYSKAYSLFFSS